MGAISSEIVHLLKVKLSLQNDQMTRDGFSCLLGFQNFSGEDPHTPPSRLENMSFIV